MAYLGRNHSRKNVIVLLGPSGCGKTTFGCTACMRTPGPYHPSSMFLSTGDKLREGNYISAWQEPNMIEIKEYCHELISKTFMNFKASESPELILDCVKDLEDAEFVAAQANKYGLKITRALLVNIDEEQLERCWQRRADNTDMFRMMRGSLHQYLLKWKRKSNDVINYYMNLKLLSKIPGPPSWRRNMSFYEYPICLPPNNLQFVLLDSNRVKNVFTKLHSVLNICQFQFTLPASFVHSYHDAKWVANSTCYYVTIKADGVRCLLLKIHDGTYLITRKNEIYLCHIEDDKLPENTVLDGELLPSTSISEIHPKMNTSQLKTSVFLVFDVLAESGDVLWKWPFSLRLESLGKLSIRKDIVAVMKQASADDQSSAERKSDTVEEMLTVHCATKGHRQSTPEDIRTCLESAFPYSCDGLVFTPDKAYVFGPDPLMFKWQSEDDVHCDIQLDSAGNVSTKSEVFECFWNQATSSWDPLFVRHDKVTPNSDKTIAHLKKICQQPYTKEYLMSNLAQVKIFEKQHEAKSGSSEQSARGHPTNSFSFDELFSNLNELVQLGEVEKTVDSATGLEIFTYRASASFSNPMVRLSRGLVLHPPSKTVVTRPFVRFFEDMSNRDPDEMVEATIKYDGSLGIAFLWNSEVMVTTRRRMDSEQAIWAKQWINDNCNLTKFLAGYTYLFEMIYRNNTVIVNYLFEGLVLLAITDESGHELPYEEVLHCARVIGFFMVAPRIIAPYSDVLWYCGGIEPSEETATPNWPPFTSGALPLNEKRQEGWVVKFNDGSRRKMVYRWWKNASKLAHRVHPQVVWLLLKHDKIKEVFGNAPNHFQGEIRRMVQAIGSKFEETLRLVERCLKMPSSEELVDEWRDSKLDDKSDDLERNEEFTLSIEDSEANNDRLRQLVVELKPYRHARLRVYPVTYTQIIKRPLFSYEDCCTFPNIERPALVYKTYIDESNVNISPFYNPFKLSFLRLPILNYICPTSPILEGYEPGDNFKQTWCKGWKQLSMTNQWQVVQSALQRNKSVPLFLQLPAEIIIMILDFLDHASLTALAKVCIYLRQIIKSCKTRLSFKKKKKPYDYDEEPWKRNRHLLHSFEEYYERSTNYGVCGSQ